jgi:transposase InsO family protein
MRQQILAMTTWFERYTKKTKSASFLELYGLTPSMSRRADCWDNAVTETLLRSLKAERLHCERFVSVRVAKRIGRISPLAHAPRNGDHFSFG